MCPAQPNSILHQAAVELKMPKLNSQAPSEAELPWRSMQLGNAMTWWRCCMIWRWHLGPCPMTHELQYAIWLDGHMRHIALYATQKLICAEALKSSNTILTLGPKQTEQTSEMGCHSHRYRQFLHDHTLDLGGTSFVALYHFYPNILDSWNAESQVARCSPHGSRATPGAVAMPSSALQNLGVDGVGMSSVKVIHGNLDQEWKPKTNNPCNPCLTSSMHNGATQAQNQEPRLLVSATLECSAPCPSCWEDDDLATRKVSWPPSICTVPAMAQCRKAQDPGNGNLGLMGLSWALKHLAGSMFNMVRRFDLPWSPEMIFGPSNSSSLKTCCLEP